MTKNQWCAKNYHKNANFVSSLAYSLIDFLDPKKGESILDLGCGEGTLALEIQKYKVSVLAIDSSKQMIKEASLKGINTQVVDILNMPFKEEFDAVFSNAVLHWLTNPNKALQNIYCSLKPKGRFIAEFGGFGNIQTLVDGIKKVFDTHPEFGNFENPWFFPSIRQYQDLLEQNGFDVKSITLTQRPTTLKSLSAWIDIFANGIIFHLDNSQKKIFTQELSNHLSNDDTWIADYVRLRVKAIKR